MPQQPTYPGVYVEEIPSGVHSVTGVATSVAAFVDFFKEGPMDQAVKIYGMGDFNRIFGGLDDRSEAGYALSQFFLNGGTEAWVIRTAGKNNLSTASVLVKAGTGPADQDILKISALSPGMWGNNLAVDIDLDTPDPNSQFNLTVTRYAFANGGSQAVAAERYLNLTLTPGPRNVETVIAQESKMVKVDYLDTAPSGVLPAATGTCSGDLSGLLLADFNNLRQTMFDISINGSDFFPATLGIWDQDAVTKPEELRRFVELAIRQANPASAAFNGASVQVVSNPALNKKHFCILAGRQANDYATSGTVHFQNHTPSGGGTTDTSAHTLLLLDADSQVNVQEYALGLVPTAITTIPNASGTTDILQLWAEQPGTNGNTLRVDVDYAAAGANRFHLTIRQYPSPAGDAMASSTVTLANLTMDQADPNYVVTAVNVSASLRAKHLTAGTANAAVLPAANGLLSGDLSGLVTADFDALRGKKIKIGVGSGTPKSATITADAAWTDGAVTSLAQLLPYLQIAIQGADSSLSQASVTVVKGKYFQIRAGKSAGVNYSPANLLQVVNQSTTDKTAELLKLTETAGATAATLTSDAPQEYALALPALGALHYAETGADGEKPGATELLGVRVKPYSGLYALENTDLFNLLCLPRAAELEDTEMTSLVSSALQYCRERRAFFLIDIPKNVSTVEAMDKWMQDHANFRDPNSAVYYPRLQQPDPVREYQLRSVGSSGTMAGLYSRIDSTRGVWKAPAGTEATLAGLSGLDAQVTDMQNGALNPLGINCFRTFPVYGMVSWGGRTSHGSDQQASDWKYIPVRRLALFLEESLFRGTKWVVFEPNDEPLWAKIRLNLNAFMTNLFRQGAFQGSTPDQAFYVKCDSDTTTQNDRNLGVVNIEVGFAPLKPAEFVVLKFQQIAGQL